MVSVQQEVSMSIFGTRLQVELRRLYQSNGAMLEGRWYRASPRHIPLSNEHYNVDPSPIFHCLPEYRHKCEGDARKTAEKTMETANLPIASFSISYWSALQGCDVSRAVEHEVIRSRAYGAGKRIGYQNHGSLVSTQGTVANKIWGVRCCSVKGILNCELR